MHTHVLGTGVSEDKLDVTQLHTQQVGQRSFALRAESGGGRKK